MKVIGISGSPRENGNCNTLVERFMTESAKRGAETKFYVINSMNNIKGCQACGACKSKSEHCIIEDDLTEVLRDIETSDIVVYATPVYFGDASAQFKLAFDRHYSFLKGHVESRLPKGKQAVFILCQGHDDEKMYAEIFKKYEGRFKFLGFSGFHPVHMTGTSAPDTATSRPEILTKIDNLVSQIIK